MKNIIYILLSATMLTSCVGVKNTINRASVEEGESFIKYGIDGYPDGIEVHKVVGSVVVLYFFDYLFLSHGDDVYVMITIQR